ncbi:MAG: winged helix-turn-helix domain-containing protein [Oscillospiraceae bacterium]|nr:winged helix-turn-helix domain-containing protein [Oscillospiraceae bacterium]
MKQDILRVQMFGKFELTYGDQKISCTGSRSKLLWNLLAYLLCHKGELISSEELIPIIWKYDKNDNPAGAMRTAIHRARSMIGELTNDSSVQFLISKNGGYMWNPEIETDFDVENFDKLVSKTAEKDNAEACLEAIEIYEGKFLPMQSSELWVMPVQAYYHNIYESLIDQVVPFLEKENRFEEGIVICNSALKIDPYSEKIYQYLMRFLLIAEDRQEVVRVYEEMSKLLLTTFGIMPDQESRALYREALSSVKNGTVISPEIVQEQLCEQGDIKGALVCDYDFFKMLYQSQARAIVRSGIVVHTALLTVKSRNKQEVSSKSVSLAMDHLEEHLQKSLRKGDIITRCSSTQFMVMLTSSNYENSCKVCQRFISSYSQKYPHSLVYVDYYVQPLIPSTNS